VVVVGSRARHPVYDNIPIGIDGCSLDNQQIEMLDFWHKKASNLLEPWGRPGDITDEQEAYFQKIHSYQWDCYNAAMEREATNSHELALLLGIIVRHNKANGGPTEDCCEFLSGDTLAKLAQAALNVSEMPTPQKRVGALRKGNKLTRTGMLYRYQSFLIKELETLSWFLYGSRDYAKCFSAEDDAVNERCRGRNSKGHRYRFFNEHTLPARARTVLKSLKIDIETAGRH
jgi:hypothetical protein